MRRRENILHLPDIGRINKRKHLQARGPTTSNTTYIVCLLATQGARSSGYEPVRLTTSLKLGFPLSIHCKTAHDSSSFCLYQHELARAAGSAWPHHHQQQLRTPRMMPLRSQTRVFALLHVFPRLALLRGVRDTDLRRGRFPWLVFPFVYLSSIR